MEQKNDNLSKYRERLQEQNKSLVLRAIEHIKTLNGVISFSMVSKVTYDISDALKGEKGISLAGISKNKLYRSLVLQAQQENDNKTGEPKKLSKSNISMGDIQMNFHALRVNNIELKQKVKILESKLKENTTPIETMKHIDENLIKQHNQLSQICFSLISRLLELELVYINIDERTLNVSMYDDVILQKESLEMVYREKLDELRN